MHPTRHLLASLTLGALTLLAAAPAAAHTLTPPAPEAPAGLGVGALRLDAAWRGVAEPEYGRRYYKRQVYTTGPYTPPPPQEVVVVTTPPPPPQRIIIERPAAVERDLDISLALRTVGISYGDTELASGTLDGEDVGGVGLALRVGLDNHWGIEVAADFAGGSSADAQVQMMPVTVSLLARLFPDSILDLYGIAGGGIHYTKVDYRLPAGDTTYMRWGGHVGGGAELALTRHILLTADVRYLIMQAAPDGVPQLQRDDQALASADTPAPAVVKEDVEDTVINGVQFMFGVGWQW